MTEETSVKGTTLCSRWFVLVGIKFTSVTTRFRIVILNFSSDDWTFYRWIAEKNIVNKNHCLNSLSPIIPLSSRPVLQRYSHPLLALSSLLWIHLCHCRPCRSLLSIVLLFLVSLWFPHLSPALFSDISCFISLFLSSIFYFILYSLMASSFISNPSLFFLSHPYLSHSFFFFQTSLFYFYEKSILCYAILCMYPSIDDMKFQFYMHDVVANMECSASSFPLLVLLHYLLCFLILWSFHELENDGVYSSNLVWLLCISISTDFVQLFIFTTHLWKVNWGKVIFSISSQNTREQIMVYERVTRIPLAL